MRRNPYCENDASSGAAYERDNYQRNIIVVNIYNRRGSWSDYDRRLDSCILLSTDIPRRTNGHVFLLRVMKYTMVLELASERNILSRRKSSYFGIAFS